MVSNWFVLNIYIRSSLESAFLQSSTGVHPPGFWSASWSEHTVGRFEAAWNAWRNIEQLAACCFFNCSVTRHFSNYAFYAFNRAPEPRSFDFDLIRCLETSEQRMAKECNRDIRDVIKTSLGSGNFLKQQTLVGGHGSARVSWLCGGDTEWWMAWWITARCWAVGELGMSRDVA